MKIARKLKSECGTAALRSLLLEAADGGQDMAASPTLALSLCLQVRGARSLHFIASCDNLNFLNVVGGPPRMFLNLNRARIESESVCHCSTSCNRNRKMVFFDSLHFRSPAEGNGSAFPGPNAPRRKAHHGCPRQSDRPKQLRARALPRH